MLNKIRRLINKKGSRFYGYVILNTNVPERPETEAFVNAADGIVYINKGAHAGANVVRLIFR